MTAKAVVRNRNVMMSDLSVLIVSALCAVGLFLMAWGLSARRRRRRLAREAAKGAEAGGAAGAASPAPRGSDAADLLARRLEQRVEALEGRLGSGNADEKLQAMAGSLLALVRDKNAAMETAMAGLDQLRARMRTLEQMGSNAEARGIFEGLAARLDSTQAAQAAGEAALSARIAALEAAEPGAALAGQFARLMEHKDAGLAAVLERLDPMERRLEELRAAQAELAAAGTGAAAAQAEPLRLRLAALEAAVERRDPQPLLDAFAARLDAMHSAQEARLVALENRAREADPRAALDTLAERLQAVQGRLARLETPGESPFAEISEQLTKLYAQKDAGVEAVLARLAPLEARLSAVERGVSAPDPQAALDRFAERLAALEAPGESPFAEISAQLTKLYAQKDAAVEAVLARLAPLEARLAGFERELAGLDPRAALDRFGERLEGLRAAVEPRLAALEAPRENPFAEIAEQLTRLYAQKDATAEAVLARLAPLEARLGSMEREFALADPQAALARLAERLEAVQARVAGLELPGEPPFAEITEQLIRLQAQKDVAAESLLARLTPLEARLEALQGRVGDLEAPGEDPLAGLAEELARLRAERDATMEAVAGRLAALEAGDPRAALAELTERIAALQAAQGTAAERLAALQAVVGEGQPFAEISGQLAELHAQKDAAVEAVAARLAPLEARLAEIEARPVPASADEARAHAEEIAAQMIALRAAAAQTELFADRLALLETSLPRLSAAQALMLKALERQGVPVPAPVPAPAPAPVPAPAAADPAVPDLTGLPRVVSLHHG